MMRFPWFYSSVYFRYKIHVSLNGPNMIVSRLTPDQGLVTLCWYSAHPRPLTRPGPDTRERLWTEREREGGGPGRATCFPGQHGCTEPVRVRCRLLRYRGMMRNWERNLRLQPAAITVNLNSARSNNYPVTLQHTYLLGDYKDKQCMNESIQTEQIKNKDES